MVCPGRERPAVPPRSIDRRWRRLSDRLAADAVISNAQLGKLRAADSPASRRRRSGDRRTKRRRGPTAIIGAPCALRFL